MSEFVLNDIRKYARLAADEKNLLAKKLIAVMHKNNGEETGSLKRKICETEKRLAEIKMRLKNLYEDKCTGAIPESVFTELMNDFSAERETLEGNLSRLNFELNNIQETTSKVNDWIDLISQYTDLQELIRDVVFGLIESITVSERKKLYDRNVQEITIRYRFICDLLQKDKEDIA